MATRKESRPLLANTEIAYMAGFFDGEGSVSVWKRKNRERGYVVCAQISQVDPRPLSLFHGHYGGSLTQHRNDYRFANSRPIWKWRLEGYALTWFLEDMLPYLIEKKDAVDKALSVRRLLKCGGPYVRYSTTERLAIDNVVTAFRSK